MHGGNKKFWILEACLLGLVILALSMLLAGSRPARKKRVVCVLNDSSDQNWTDLYEGMRLSARQHDIEFVMADTEKMQSPSEMREIIADEALDGIDALIVQQIGQDEKAILPEKLSASIPKVYLNGNCEADSKNINVSLEADAVGEKLVKEIEKDLKDLSGKTAGLVLPETQSPVSEKCKTVIEKLLKEKNTEIIWEIHVSDQTENTQENLAAQKAPDIVIGCDSECLSEAAACIGNGGLVNARIYGIGNSEECIQDLDHDTIQGILVPDSFLMGYTAMEESWQMLRHHGTGENAEITGRYFRKTDIFKTRGSQMYLFPMQQM